MPQGSKAKYTDKQKREAEHIEESYENKGVGEGEAERRAWATVNKQTGGGEKGGSGNHKSAASKSKSRSETAKKAAATRKRRGE
jgi:plasmid stabilization system protein ParE